ncbi:MAG: TIGR00730 family Rossman fold protein [Anaerolineae bacterium]
MRICVYCSSSSAVDKVYHEAADAFGRLLARRGHSLVYGGGRVGLMGELARAVKEEGGHIVGVIPRRLEEFDLAYQEVDEIIVTESMAERKHVMEQRAQAYVVLPGGFGTLEEMAQALTLKQLKYIRGAMVLLNVDEFYDPLLAYFEQLYEKKFARPIHRQLYHVADTPAAALDYIENYRHRPLPEKWFLGGKSTQ